ncbi:response regulator transcription factor [Streptomyces sp. NPDC014891]|uniref:response regulator transcription factor n=1 Tax=Streptomyces sp. NPDC014891 TaxID=3364929 RepID=UPI0037000EAA
MGGAARATHGPIHTTLDHRTAASPGPPPGVDGVGSARDSGEAVALTAEPAPDVVLMDLRMPHLFAKTGVRDRTQAVRYAYQHGLVRPPGRRVT